MNNTQPATDPYAGSNDLSLIVILKTLVKRRYLIIILTLLVTLAAGLINFLVIKPVYQARTLLMVTIASEKLEVNDDLIIRKGDSTSLQSGAAMPVLTMNTYLGQLKSEILMKRVMEALELNDLTINRFAQMIEASIVKDSNLIEVKVNHNDPEMASRIANTLAREYLMLMEEFMFSSVVVISPANTPVIPVRPLKVINTALSFMLAFILSSVLALVLEYLDNTIKTPEDIGSGLDLPLLGIIPLQTEALPKEGPCLVTMQIPLSAASEAYRTLRTNLGFAGIDRPFRSILVTSPQPLDGKSTVTANLAVVMAQAGHRVLLVDGDLRKPRQHELFDLSNQIGFTSCLVRNTNFSAAVLRTEQDDLSVLTSGPRPPNPAELLDSSRFRKMWDHLFPEYDFVLIDSAPILAVTDPVILAAMADAVILVVRSESTERDAALQAREQLARANARLLGVILNQVKIKSSNYYT